MEYSSNISAEELLWIKVYIWSCKKNNDTVAATLAADRALKQMRVSLAK